MYGDTVVPGVLHRVGHQDPGARLGHGHHLLVLHLRKELCPLDDTRVGREHSRDIGEYLA